MEVILIENVEKLGKPGDVVNVKKGYARNFLFPRKLAMEASAKGMKFLEERKKRRERELEKEKQEMQGLAARVSAVSCTVAMAAGEEDKLFGSVTAEQIKEALAAEGVQIDKKQIDIAEPIKKLGVYQIKVKLHPEVTAATKVWVVRK